MHFTFQDCFIFPFVNLDSRAERGCSLGGVRWAAGAAAGGRAGTGRSGLQGRTRARASSLSHTLGEGLILISNWNSVPDKVSAST